MYQEKVILELPNPADNLSYVQIADLFKKKYPMLNVTNVPLCFVNLVSESKPYRHDSFDGTATFYLKLDYAFSDFSVGFSRNGGSVSLTCYHVRRKLAKIGSGKGVFYD
jgi:hypothetical protein